MNPFQNSFVRLVQVIDETEPVKRMTPCGSPVPLSWNCPPPRLTLVKVPLPQKP